MRKARDRTAVAVRLSSIPISLASIPFKDNSRRRSSSAAVQSFTDHPLNPFARVIGPTPSSPSVRALDEMGIGFCILLRRHYPFLSRWPRHPKMELSKRDKAQDSALGPMKRLAPIDQEANRARIAAACKAAEAVAGWIPFFNQPHLVSRSLWISRVSAGCERAAADSIQRRLFRHSVTID
jgi:hypothetical protein